MGVEKSTDKDEFFSHLSDRSYSRRDPKGIWSPDGKKIVYSSNVGGSYDIWLMNSDGESQKRLTTSPGLEINPTWSPDGKLIAFTRFNNNRLEIWTVDPGTGQVKPLIQEKTDCRDPVWF